MAAVNSLKKLPLGYAFGFGVAFLVVVLIFAVFVPDPTPFEYLVFRITLALAAAGVAAVIPGTLNVKISGFITAGGALAVFVIVYFYSPAVLTKLGYVFGDPVYLSTGTEVTVNKWRYKCFDGGDKAACELSREEEQPRPENVYATLVSETTREVGFWSGGKRIIQGLLTVTPQLLGTSIILRIFVCRTPGKTAKMAEKIPASR